MELGSWGVSLSPPVTEFWPSPPAAPAADKTLIPYGARSPFRPVTMGFLQVPVFSASSFLIQRFASVAFLGFAPKQFESMSLRWYLGTCPTRPNTWVDGQWRSWPQPPPQLTPGPFLLDSDASLIYQSVKPEPSGFCRQEVPV